VINRSLPLAALTAALLLLPAAAAAQGTLSTQGFGYPGGGQIGTRALGAGGALAEGDALSATNPAAIFNLGGSILYFQAEPEYRRVSKGAFTEAATIARYPLVTAGVPIGSAFFAGLTVSNLLDRTFSTTTRTTQTVRGEPVSSTNSFTSDGAIGDVRVALAWAPARWLHLGVAGHAVTGDNELNSTQRFDDTTRFATIVDTQTVTYTGTAYSAGFDISAGQYATVSGSYRHGGALSVKRGDTTLRNGHVPDRVAIGLAFVGIRGATIGIRTARDRWSNLAPLGLPTQRVSEGWDTSIGADVLGPRMFGVPLQLRAGARTRTLPFGVSATSSTQASDVTERSYSFGTGGLLARGRASFDLAAIRAMREASTSGVTENAWTLSVGLSVRP
jgi:hypothetical protein